MCACERRLRARGEHVRPTATALPFAGSAGRAPASLLAEFARLHRLVDGGPALGKIDLRFGARFIFRRRGDGEYGECDGEHDPGDTHLTSPSFRWRTGDPYWTRRGYERLLQCSVMSITPPSV